MFGRVADGETEMVVVVHVDDILAHAKDHATMKSFAAEFGKKFKLKDMGNASYYMGCHIARDRKARELKLDQHLYVKSMVVKFGVEKTSVGQRGCRRACWGSCVSILVAWKCRRCPLVRVKF